MVIFLAALALFLLALAIGGALVDYLDPYDERADDRRRNRR
ncbi:MAG TPA: hypothetical protein VMW52_07495 [Phycisphaerae bacterium]|nr:hypothetical protein [Phycisphaerae bacterium]